MAKKFRYNTTTFLIDEVRRWDSPAAKAGHAIAEDDAAEIGKYYEGGEVRDPNAAEIKLKYQQNRRSYIDAQMPVHEQIEALREKLMEASDTKADALQAIVATAKTTYPAP